MLLPAEKAGSKFINSFAFCLSCRARSGIQLPEELKRHWIPGHARNDKSAEIAGGRLPHTL